MGTGLYDGRCETEVLVRATVADEQNEPLMHKLLLTTKRRYCSLSNRHKAALPVVDDSNSLATQLWIEHEQIASRVLRDTDDAIRSL
jgi:hypothetical protein